MLRKYHQKFDMEFHQESLIIFLMLENVAGIAPKISPRISFQQKFLVGFLQVLLLEFLQESLHELLNHFQIGFLQSPPRIHSGFCLHFLNKFWKHSWSNLRKKKLLKESQDHQKDLKEGTIPRTFQEESLQKSLKKARYKFSEFSGTSPRTSINFAEHMQIPRNYQKNL